MYILRQPILTRLILKKMSYECLVCHSYLFKDRRVVVRGMWYAYLIAKELELDLIHTTYRIWCGILGKWLGKNENPCHPYVSYNV